MPELSIIVPVYRAESFLSHCVESLMGQSFQDLEIILVDDGSPDRSGELCDSYAARDPRVRVIHQKNSGVSAARNRGLQEAKGTYIGFADSDDWAELTMFESMLAASEGADIVMCDALTVYDDGTTEPDTIRGLPESRMLSHGDCTPELMLELAGAVWRCIYKRELLQTHEIRFPQGMKVSEDRVFNLYAMGRAEKIFYLKEPLYCRYVNLQSCVNSFHKDYLSIAERIRQELQQVISAAWDNRADFQQAFSRQYADFLLATVDNLRKPGCTLPGREKRKVIRQICSLPELQSILREMDGGDDQLQLVLKKKILCLYYYERPFYRKISNLRELFAAEGTGGVIRKCVGKCRK